MNGGRIMVDEYKSKDERFITASIRGEKFMDDLMSEAVMIDDTKVSKLTQMPKSIIRVWRQQGKVIFFEHNGEIKYPKWQFHKEYGVVHKGIKETISIFENNNIDAYRSLMEVFPDGSGELGYQKIHEGCIDQVLEHFKSQRLGNFT
jgi:hypothetical protein